MGSNSAVAIARALVHEPPLIVADEPTAHLDHVQVEGVLRLLRELASPGRLVVVSTHDDRISNLADRVVELAPKAELGEAEPHHVSLADGQVVFEQGDMADFVYIVDSGLIEIYRLRPDRSEERLTLVTPGSYFGELGPVLNMPRSAYARAAAPTELTAYTVPPRSGPGSRARSPAGTPPPSRRPWALPNGKRDRLACPRSPGEPQGRCRRPYHAAPHMFIAARPATTISA